MSDETIIHCHVHVPQQDIEPLLERIYGTLSLEFNARKKDILDGTCYSGPAGQC
jgi:hypothetical protein